MKCIEVNPEFAKGYSRKGKALFDLMRWPEAEEAYAQGLRLDPSNDECKKGFETVIEKLGRADTANMEIYKLSNQARKWCISQQLTQVLDFIRWPGKAPLCPQWVEKNRHKFQEHPPDSVQMKHLNERILGGITQQITTDRGVPAVT